ncbi:MAG: tetratricopeptide repeat protein [Elusimicrobia bacterium]|nr:tetratricopeptide repeat protein [Elusimicrobiota bacterium]
MDLKKSFLVFLAFAVFVGSAFASAGEVFAEANKLYENQKWAESEKLYKSLLDDGYDNWQIFYNLANCYYRLGEIPLAHLYYLKALHRAPRNEDITYNIGVVRKSLSLKLRKKGIVAAFLDYFKLDELMISTAVLWWAIFLLLAIFVKTRKEILIWFVSVIFIFFGFSSAALYAKIDREKPGRRAVVMRNGNLLSGPGAGYKVIVEVPAGVVAEILDEESGWAQIAISGNRGWIETKTLGKI